MERKSQKRLTDPHSYVTFDDVFALALANTKADRFFADADKWQRVLYDVARKYRDKIPALKSMFFDESRSPLPAQSEDFYLLINILSGSKLISLPNPTFGYICMDKSQKAHARRLEEEMLKQHREYIEEIGRMLEEKLAVR